MKGSHAPLIDNSHALLGGEQDYCSHSHTGRSFNTHCWCGGIFNAGDHELREIEGWDHDEDSIGQ